MLTLDDLRIELAELEADLNESMHSSDEEEELMSDIACLESEIEIWEVALAN